MMVSRRLIVVCLSGWLVGCGAHAKPVLPPAASLPVTPLDRANAPEVPLAPDPIADLVSKAEAEFTAGQHDLDAGKRESARGHFDQAIDLLMSSPTGARSEPRLSAELDRLLDQISALDILALRESDGFTETQSEPAAIDELLGAAMFERPTAAPTTEETVRADLARSQHDIDIPLNDQVLSYVELFQGRLHDFMEAGLERGLRYMPMIQRVFQSEGLPLDLAYVPLVESAFKPNALSRVSARGMWQFMSDTGAAYGLEQNWFLDERSDPEKATRAAAQYLKALYDNFGDDWNLALASYNAGPGRLQRAIQRAHTDDFWALSASTKYLPRDTREYVPMIMAAIIIGSHPALYGFEVGSAAPLAYERVSVPNALDLKTIAEWIGVSVDELRDLNPELRRTTTPVTEHDLKVPLGTAATVRMKLATADPLYVHFDFHRVKRGETLSTIARKYRVSLSELRLANDLTSRSRIRVNQTLMIPRRTTAGLPSTPARSAKAAGGRGAAPTSYRVRRGDTLFSIARQFSTTVDDLKTANRLRTDRIHIGDRLTLPQ
ncbi:MAG TPA: LysM peptidoglycan-binding domain-containing protein [Vicinamibacterales bacterium]|jgi:membrane-bound lytic murein transglycosylase D|nr:LysM peptidoglycan-binding domain-containing protein [Vicinamibacterales bacterium]